MSHKYEIGQVLTHRAFFEPYTMSGETSWVESGNNVIPPRFFVVEKITQQCPGGFQYCYSVRYVNCRGVEDKLISFNEVELIPYPPKQK